VVGFDVVGDEVVGLEVCGDVEGDQDGLNVGESVAGLSVGVEVVGAKVVTIFAVVVGQMVHGRTRNVPQLTGASVLVAPMAARPPETSWCVTLMSKNSRPFGVYVGGHRSVGCPATNTNFVLAGLRPTVTGCGTSHGSVIVGDRVGLDVVGLPEGE